MEPDEIPNEKTLKELLETYDVAGMDTPFKEWFHRAIEQEYNVAPESTSIVFSVKEEKKKEVGFKVGDLVKRRSFVSEGSIGIVTRVDKVTSQYSIGSEPSQPTKKYLVTFQHDGSRAWFNEDQLDKVE